MEHSGPQWTPESLFLASMYSLLWALVRAMPWAYFSCMVAASFLEWDITFSFLGGVWWQGDTTCNITPFLERKQRNKRSSSISNSSSTGMQSSHDFRLWLKYLTFFPPQYPQDHSTLSAKLPFWEWSHTTSWLLGELHPPVLGEGDRLGKARLDTGETHPVLTNQESKEHPPGWGTAHSTCVRCWYPKSSL